MHLDTFMNMLPAGAVILYSGFPSRKIMIDVIMRIPGTPKASEKQSSESKHLTSSRRIGVIIVDTNDPEFTAK